MLVTSPFGRRIHPVTGEAKLHAGVDFAAELGAPVVSASGGRVARVDRDGEGRGRYNGNAVFVEDGPYRWAYLHLSRVAVVPGQVVRPGELLGAVGSTGRSTGPHLHLALTVNGQPVDPLPLFPPNSWRFA